MIKIIELNKNNICIDLRKLSKIELAELFDILENNGQNIYFSNNLDFSIKYFNSDINTHLEFDFDYWVGGNNDENKFVVTFKELKQILKENENI